LSYKFKCNFWFFGQVVKSQRKSQLVANIVFFNL
jgi:hypothetical protein